MNTTRYSQLEPLEIDDSHSVESGDRSYATSPISSPILLEKCPLRARRNLHLLPIILIRKLLWFMVPSPIQDYIKNDPETHYWSPVRSTTWLDGLRGIACLLVMCGHWVGKYEHWMVWPYGVRYSNLMQLPYLRLFLGTYPMVACFFSISGYALSLKAIRCIRKRTRSGVQEAYSIITSGIFRRWIRLCIPAIASTILTMFFTHFGFMEAFDECIRTGGCNPPYYKAPRLPFWTQIADWYRNVFHRVVFNLYLLPHEIGDSGQNYNGHLWTIPVEFTSSMIVFMVTIAMANVRTWIRLSMLVLFMIHAMYMSQNIMTPFFFGMFLAEVDLIRDERRQPNRPNSHTPRLLAFFQRDSYVQFIFFAIGLFLFSQPLEGIDQAFFFGSVWHLVPPGVHPEEKTRFIPNIGVMFTMWAISNSPRLKRLFTNDAVHYLGRISFMVYILHGEWGLNLSGVWIMNKLWWVFGSKSNPHPKLGTWLALPPTIVLTVWMADMFWKAVDMPSVKFARWLEEMCTFKEY